MSSRLISYSQRLEDLYLLRCFARQSTGFYIDIGLGHPVYDNVSFAFYLKGWSGLTAEPNPRLAALTRAIRPRDRVHEGVVGTVTAAVDFYLVDHFHGFSTGIAANAEAALEQFGAPSEKITVQSVTLADLCAGAAPEVIDFLKVDVEGAEADVLHSGDWTRFRPKVVVVEALAPYTQAPAWATFDQFLTAQGYQFVWFDSLNRYYIADEAQELRGCFAQGAIDAEGAEIFRNAGRALEQPAHMDHHTAHLIASGAMARLPLLDASLLVDLLTADCSAAHLSKPATEGDMQQICERVLGHICTDDELKQLAVPAGAPVRECYARLVDSDPFRAACGRISAGYAW